MDLKKFIVPKTIDNTDNYGYEGDPTFRTQDLIYLDAGFEIENMPDEERICYPTDYAVITGAITLDNDEHENRKSCHTALRSSNHTFCNLQYLTPWGNIAWNIASAENNSLRPILQLNISAVISARKSRHDIFKIHKYISRGKVKLHTIEFGEYPKTYVGDELNKYLEEEMDLEMKKGTLKPTWKRYLGGYFIDETPTYNYEYMFYGKRFVRVEQSVCFENSEFLDGTKAQKDGTFWVKVEPIIWIIKNWDELPKEINPNGSGKATIMEIQTVECIRSGIPFYPNDEDKYRYMWQNSTIRGYLNGYNVNNIKTNGNTEYSAPNGGDFSKHSFLTEAFDNVFTLTNLTSNQNDLDEDLKEGELVC